MLEKGNELVIGLGNVLSLDVSILTPRQDEMTNLALSNSEPSADHIANRALAIAAGTAEDIEQHGKPAFDLCAQECNVCLGGVLADGRRACRLRKLHEQDVVARRKGNARVDHDLQGLQDRGPELGLSVKQLRKELRELGRQ